MRWNLLMGALACSWGFVAVLVAATDADAVTLTVARLGLAALTLAIIALVAHRRRLLSPAGRLPALAALGTVQAVHWLLFIVAVKHGSVALAVLTFYTAPVLIAVGAPLVLGDAVSNVALGALVPGLIGIWLVATAGPGGGYSGWAVAAGLGSAATYACLVILSKRLLRGAVPPLTVAFWDCLVGACVAAPVLLLVDLDLPGSAADIGGVVVLGVVFTGLATLAYTALLRHVTAQAAGVLTFVEPVAAVLLAALLLDETLTDRVLLGGALVLVAGVCVAVLEPPDDPITETAPPVGSGAQ